MTTTDIKKPATTSNPPSLLQTLLDCEMPQHGGDLNEQAGECMAFYDALGWLDWVTDGDELLDFDAARKPNLTGFDFSLFQDSEPTVQRFISSAIGLGCYAFADHLTELWT